MILDISEVDAGLPISCDLCIVGSGAAGITMAREFIGTSYSVVVLEGGGRSFEAASQDPYRSEVVGLEHSVHEGRVRVVGGTTTLWAGQILPLLDVDFRKRDWVPYSGWPFNRSTLEPFYRRAEDVAEVPHVTNDLETWPKLNAPPPAYNAAKLVPYYSQFTHEPNFANKYGRELEAARNITLLTHANAVGVEVNEHARAAGGVLAQSFEGKSLRVIARFVVVCCGGIESARLLLLSDSVEPNGVGNGYDVVGRFFQEHPSVGVPIRPRNPRLFAKLYDSFRKGRVGYSLKIAASPQLQERQSILHVGAEIYYPPTEDDPINAAKRVLKAVRDPSLRPELPQALFSVAKRPGHVLRAAFRHYILNQPPKIGSTQPHVGIGVEQEPNPRSCVRLSRDLDRLGQRRVVLDWQLAEAETRSIEVFAQTLADEWDRLDIADVDLANVQIRGRERGAHGGYTVANHHIGTTRMGTDPKTSVVDERCRVHGYQNLYIGSSSVFPTGGFSNPTLTILALCLRIADEVKAALRRGDAVALQAGPNQTQPESA